MFFHLSETRKKIKFSGPQECNKKNDFFWPYKKCIKKIILKKIQKIYKFIFYKNQKNIFFLKKSFKKTENRASSVSGGARVRFRTHCRGDLKYYIIWWRKCSRWQNPLVFSKIVDFSGVPDTPQFWGSLRPRFRHLPRRKKCINQVFFSRFFGKKILFNFTKKKIFHSSSIFRHKNIVRLIGCP